MSNLTSWEGVIQTFSGKIFKPFDPNPDGICIEDIAHSLSQQCRFTGHTSLFYSIAQHSVLVSLMCDPKDALWGLLHDASEAYLCDIAHPVKHSGAMQSYRRAEARVMLAVCDRFELGLDMPESVHEADYKMLITEARDLMPPADWYNLADCYDGKVIPWSANWSEIRFLNRFKELQELTNGE
jgi:uncharacterized protein